MKKLILIILVGISYPSFAQLNSYIDSKYDVLITFNLFYSHKERADTNNIYVISAKDGYEITEQMGPFEKQQLVLEKAFELADCLECELVSEIITEKPIDYIFELIEYQDVFLVKVHEDQYKVIRYQPKE